VLSALLAGIGLLVGACTPGGGAESATSTPAIASPAAEPGGTPTESYPTVPAISANTLADADVGHLFGAVAGASALSLRVNVTPPGERGDAVSGVSIVARDDGQVLRGLDDAGKRALGTALLDAAAAAFPRASVTLLVSDAAGGGQIIGSRPASGANTVIVS
jgi:hypothetical protein